MQFGHPIFNLTKNNVGRLRIMRFIQLGDALGEVKIMRMLKLRSETLRVQQSN
jgi:hypothetical protein